MSHVWDGTLYYTISVWCYTCVRGERGTAESVCRGQPELTPFPLCWKGLWRCAAGVWAVPMRLTFVFFANLIVVPSAFFQNCITEGAWCIRHKGKVGTTGAVLLEARLRVRSRDLLVMAFSRGASRDNARGLTTFGEEEGFREGGGRARAWGEKGRPRCPHLFLCCC